jgi:hypothetical protein
VAARHAAGTPETESSARLAAGTEAMVVDATAFRTIAMAAKGKAPGSIALAAVPSPCPAAPIPRPRATGALTPHASRAASPKLATSSPVSTCVGWGSGSGRWVKAVGLCLLSPPASREHLRREAARALHTACRAKVKTKQDRAPGQGQDKTRQVVGTGASAACVAWCVRAAATGAHGPCRSFLRPPPPVGSATERCLP